MLIVETVNLCPSVGMRAGYEQKSILDALEKEFKCTICNGLNVASTVDPRTRLRKYESEARGEIDTNKV
jgi:hypothetical protein